MGKKLLRWAGLGRPQTAAACEARGSDRSPSARRVSAAVGGLRGSTAACLGPNSVLFGQIGETSSRSGLALLGTAPGFRRRPDIAWFGQAGGHRACLVRAVTTSTDRAPRSPHARRDLGDYRVEAGTARLLCAEENGDIVWWTGFLVMMPASGPPPSRWGASAARGLPPTGPTARLRKGRQQIIWREAVLECRRTAAQRGRKGLTDAYK